MGRSLGCGRVLPGLVVCISIGFCVSGDLGGQKSDEITLEREKIFVNFINGTDFSIEIEPDDTVVDLKICISDYEGIPVLLMELYLGDVRLQYNKKLSDYKIKTGTTLTLVVSEDSGHRTIKFIVKTRDGRELPVEIQLSKSVSKLKDDLAQLTGISPAQQRLLLHGNALKDDRKLLHYGINNYTTIELGAPLEDCRRAVNIFVKTLSGATIELEVNLADTVADLKEKIWERTGVPAGVQQLTANQQAIGGLDHLCDLDLKAGSIVYMILYSPRITSLEQVARLRELPVRAVDPHRAPIFHEAEEAGECAQSGGRQHVSLYKDARNWLVHMQSRPRWDLDAFDRVAYLIPNPDDELAFKELRVYLASEPKYGPVKAEDVRARIKLSSAVRPYRVAANLNSVGRPRRIPGITLGGGGFTDTNSGQLVPLGADVNNWAPDAFSDLDVMRLFQVVERLRQVQAKAVQTGEALLTIDSQRRINRAILATYLEALAGYPPTVEYGQPREGEECGICRDELTAEPAVKLGCKHAFHADCILTWATNTYEGERLPHCPVCRRGFMFPYEALGKAELEKFELPGN